MTNILNITNICIYCLDPTSQSHIRKWQSYVQLFSSIFQYEDYEITIKIKIIRLVTLIAWHFQPFHFQTLAYTGGSQ